MISPLWCVLGVHKRNELFHAVSYMPIPILQQSQLLSKSTAEITKPLNKHKNGVLGTVFQ